MACETGSSGKAVFLDRDGVLNRTVMRNGQPYPPSDLRELVVAPGVEEGCRTLRDAGFVLVGITNQPDVVRGNTEKRSVEEINQHLVTLLGIDSFRVCYHDEGDACECRKPSPGLILQAAMDMELDLSASFMIGDRWKDIEAGTRAGCKTILIDNMFAQADRSRPTFIVRNFEQAVAAILGPVHSV